MSRRMREQGTRNGLMAGKKNISSLSLSVWLRNRKSPAAIMASLEELCSQPHPDPNAVRELCKKDGVPEALRGKIWQVIFG
jgi:hypothetical protein